MEIGYYSMPAAIDCSFGNTFRWASYFDERAMLTVVARRWRAGKPAATHTCQ